MPPPDSNGTYVSTYEFAMQLGRLPRPGPCSRASRHWLCPSQPLAHGAEAASSGGVSASARTRAETREDAIDDELGLSLDLGGDREQIQLLLDDE